MQTVVADVAKQRCSHLYIQPKARGSYLNSTLTVPLHYLFDSQKNQAVLLLHVLKGNVINAYTNLDSLTFMMWEKDSVYQYIFYICILRSTVHSLMFVRDLFGDFRDNL